MTMDGQFILFLIETICCDSSSEPSCPDELSHGDGSGEGSQYVLMQFYKKLSLIITKYSLLSRALTKALPISWRCYFHSLHIISIRIVSWKLSYCAYFPQKTEHVCCNNSKY